ncbi:cupin domain-containing protein [Sabulicella rubraurantiaca]|uniref:cupin domain-containing protein n=1 Tax=Sabulicella rubraurantiaca TaxID=2811429 RepID=UPI001A956B80|nr:cupin domain-containing protein [Sabulicella rubraurantiaca]
MGMIRVRRHREVAPEQSRTVRFQGREFGAPVSMFLTDSAPGMGSRLHRHPYPETWVVREGEAEFSVGNERSRASAGDIVVAPANVPHRFVNIGEGRLRLLCIHPSDTIVQEDL